MLLDVHMLCAVSCVSYSPPVRTPVPALTPSCNSTPADADAPASPLSACISACMDLLLPPYLSLVDIAVQMDEGCTHTERTGGCDPVWPYVQQSIGKWLLHLVFPCCRCI